MDSGLKRGGKKNEDTKKEKGRERFGTKKNRSHA